MPDRFAAFPGVREFPVGVRTAADAAQAVGCDVGAICKSLVFVRERDGAPLLVIASGANRVDEAALGVRKADAAQVRGVTGAAIGGVPPYGHPAPIETLVDEDLLAYAEVWAAAGTPTHVFPIAPAELIQRTGGRVTRVAG